MEIPDIPFDALLYTWLAVLVALPTAFLVSLVLLWLYLRAVKSSMLRRATAEPSAELGPSAYDAAANPSCRRKGHFMSKPWTWPPSPANGP